MNDLNGKSPKTDTVRLGIVVLGSLLVMGAIRVDAMVRGEDEFVPPTGFSVDLSVNFSSGLGGIRVGSRYPGRTCWSTRSLNHLPVTRQVGVGSPGQVRVVGQSPGNLTFI